MFAKPVDVKCSLKRVLEDLDGYRSFVWGDLLGFKLVIGECNKILLLKIFFMQVIGFYFD